MSVKIREIPGVSLFLLLASISCQPPSFNPMEYIFFAPDCSLPFAVYIASEVTNCSGTIIHERWVLTAARCVMKNHGRTQVKNDGITVLAGITDYTRARVATAQERKSQKIIVHGHYKLNTLSKFDLALIEVDNPFNFTDCVAKAIISADPWPKGSKNCISWGFGQIGYNKTNSRLKIWNTVGRKECPCASRFQAKRLICSSEAVGVNLCRTDLGSSLICYEGDVNPLSVLNRTDEVNESAQKNRHESKELSEANTNGDVSGLTMYGVAHMTIDKYICAITRVPKRTCVTLPTYAAYMYLCPFNYWLRQQVPVLSENIVTCGLPPLGASLSWTLLLAASVWVLLHLRV